MEHLEFKIEDGWLWIEDMSSRFEDFIMPHQHLIHIFLFIHCRESRYFEDIVDLFFFCLRMIHNFFQVWGNDEQMLTVSDALMELLHDPIIYKRTNMSLILCRFSVTNQITVWKQFDQPDESWCNDSQ